MNWKEMMAGKCPGGGSDRYRNGRHAGQHELEGNDGR
jgi:hypothetical protein